MAIYSESDQKLLTTFGSRLRDIRNEKKMSQEKLAERTNLHRTYISSVERGERNISLININKISIALDVDAILLIQ